MVRRYQPPKRPRTGKERLGRGFGVAASALLYVECVVSGILLLLAFAMLGKPGHPPGGVIEMILALAVIAILSPIALLSGGIGLLLDDQRWLRWIVIAHIALMVAAQLLAMGVMELRCLMWLLPFLRYC
jgi:hypothetical protein